MNSQSVGDDVLDRLDDERERLKIRVAHVERVLGTMSRHASGRFALIKDREMLAEQLQEVNRRITKLHVEQAKARTKTSNSALGPTGRHIDVSPWVSRVPEVALVLSHVDADVPEGYSVMRNGDYLRHVRRRLRDGHDGAIPRPLVRRSS